MKSIEDCALGIAGLFPINHINNWEDVKHHWDNEPCDEEQKTFLTNKLFSNCKIQSIGRYNGLNIVCKKNNSLKLVDATYTKIEIEKIVIQKFNIITVLLCDNFNTAFKKAKIKS